MGQILNFRGIAEPETLRRTLRDMNTPELLLRRAVIGASLLGMASMAVIALFQSGLIRHLPDPPLKGFDSDRVNASDTAYGWGMPDSPISLVSHAVNIALASFGGADRADSQPWVPLAATAASAPAAATSAGYLFYEMPVGEKGWCPYCIVDALMHMAAFGFTLWESKKALTRLAGR
jgi:uncharacterized membrane protein